MAITHGYISGTVTVGGVALTGTGQFSIVEGTMNQLDTKSDGELYETRTALIPENPTGTIELIDLETTAKIGDTGALSITGRRMTGGVAQGNTVTCAAADSTITNVTRGTDISGATTVSIEFRVNSPDGIVSGFTVTSA